MEEEKLNRMKTKLADPLAQYKIGYQLSKIIIAALIVFLLISLGVNVILAKKQQIIVGIDPSMLPVPLREKKMNLENLMDYKVFITSFLTRMYCWDCDTYISSINLAMDLMAPDIREKFRELRFNGDYPKMVADSKMIQTFKIISISDNVRRNKDGFMIDAEGIKMRVTNDSHNLTEAVKFHVSIRKCDINPSNFWGFEVFEFVEAPVVDNYEKVGRE